MTTLGAYFRLLRLGWVLVREGVVSALPSDGLPAHLRFAKSALGVLAKNRAKDTDRSDNLARAVDRLGPSYVKIGQFLATRPDVVGNQFAADLAVLQDSMATFPRAKAITQIEVSLGRPIDELFISFNEPVAAASIAQVHPASTLTGGQVTKVAVKVIRPGVRERFANDMQTNYLLARLQERFYPPAKRLKPVEITQKLEQITRIEMDLRLEAAALSELGENTKEDPGFRVPKVDWDRTGRDVVTMEWIDGVKMSDISGLRAAGHDLQHLAEVLMQSFLRHTLRDGFFHADMHQGNLFVDPQGIIVAVDMGIVGRLGKKERRFLAEILYGFITRNYTRVAEVHFEAGYVSPDHDVDSFAQAIRAIGEPIHGQAADTISMAKLLVLLFEVTELFDMQTRSELLMLQKTMVVVEGVARSLDPHFNMWKASEPVVRQWMVDNLGPGRIAQDLREGFQAMLRLARSAPQILARMESLSLRAEETFQTGIRFDPSIPGDSAKRQARHLRSIRTALWLIAGILIYIALVRL